MVMDGSLQDLPFLLVGDVDAADTVVDILVVMLNKVLVPSRFSCNNFWVLLCINAECCLLFLILNSFVPLGIARNVSPTFLVVLHWSTVTLSNWQRLAFFVPITYEEFIRYVVRVLHGGMESLSTKPFYTVTNPKNVVFVNEYGIDYSFVVHRFISLR